MTVYGFDGKPFQAADESGGPATMNYLGKPLFDPITVDVDLPKQNAVYDIKVPDQSAE